MNMILGALLMAHAMLHAAEAFSNVDSSFTLSGARQSPTSLLEAKELTAVDDSEELCPTGKHAIDSCPNVLQCYEADNLYRLGQTVLEPDDARFAQLDAWWQENRLAYSDEATCNMYSSLLDKISGRVRVLTQSLDQRRSALGKRAHPEVGAADGEPQSRQLVKRVRAEVCLLHPLVLRQRLEQYRHYCWEKSFTDFGAFYGTDLKFDEKNVISVEIPLSNFRYVVIAIIHHKVLVSYQNLHDFMEGRSKKPDSFILTLNKLFHSIIPLTSEETKSHLFAPEEFVMSHINKSSHYLTLLDSSPTANGACNGVHIYLQNRVTVSRSVYRKNLNIDGGPQGKCKQESISLKCSEACQSILDGWFEAEGTSLIADNIPQNTYIFLGQAKALVSNLTEVQTLQQSLKDPAFKEPSIVMAGVSHAKKLLTIPSTLNQNFGCCSADLFFDTCKIGQMCRVFVIQIQLREGSKAFFLRNDRYMADILSYCKRRFHATPPLSPNQTVTEGVEDYCSKLLRHLLPVTCERVNLKLSKQYSRAKVLSFSGIPQTKVVLNDTVTVSIPSIDGSCIIKNGGRVADQIYLPIQSGLALFSTIQDWSHIAKLPTKTLFIVYKNTPGQLRPHL